MGDFYLDFRSKPLRLPASRIAEQELTWFPDTQLFRIDGDEFSLILSRPERGILWSPAVSGKAPNRVVVAIAGRTALQPAEWALAEKSPEFSGGLAGRAVGAIYRAQGLAGLCNLNGNFAAVVIDEGAGRSHVVTDRGGALLCYAPSSFIPVVCSHPDVLASAIKREHALDQESLAEFIASGRVTFPHTYYRDIEALRWGTTYTFELERDGWVRRKPASYFDLQPKFEPAVKEADLAVELAEAFQAAVALRSQSILGKTAIAMSGGLDSRAILSSVEAPETIEGFILIDEENPESDAARAIAASCGVRLKVIRRDFDHYGLSAESGARIGGATGGLASNHFLGIREWFADEGIENLLTGCYCDYLFKALALNTRESLFLRRQKLDQVRTQFYRPIFPQATRYPEAVEARLREWLPLKPSQEASDVELFEVERRRIFPLAAEGDSAQRVIAQRVLPWFVPAADTGLMEMFQRIPPRMKLDGRIFRQMLQKVCPPAVLNVPDSNTGGPVLTNTISRAYYRYRSALLNRWNARVSGGLASRGSWPRWEHYLHRSELIRSQWERRHSAVTDVLEGVVGSALIARPVETFRAGEVELFQRIWTLKLWLERRLEKPARAHLSAAASEGDLAVRGR